MFFHIYLKDSVHYNLLGMWTGYDCLASAFMERSASVSFIKDSFARFMLELNVQ